MGKPGSSGLRRVVRATAYSMQGIAHAWKSEAAFRQELVVFVLLVPAAFWLGRTIVEVAMLIGVCLVTLITELLNSAVEAAIDRHGLEQHELSGAAKDMGSAAVMLSLIMAVGTWILIGAHNLLG